MVNVFGTETTFNRRVVHRSHSLRHMNSTTQPRQPAGARHGNELWSLLKTVRTQTDTRYQQRTGRFR